MFNFLKKLFGFGTTENTAPVAPYKIEAPAANESTFKNVEVAPTQVKLRQPGQPKQGGQKPAQGKKPQGQKPAGQKKPAQPKPAGQKPNGNKSRGRKPKAKPAAPQQ